MEAEIKLLIPTEQAFDAILSHVKAHEAPRPKLWQNNTFFDSESGALRAVDFSVRVRRECHLGHAGLTTGPSEVDPGRIVVTLKGPKQRSDEGAEKLSLRSLVVRPEEEVVVARHHLDSRVGAAARAHHFARDADAA